MRWDPRRHHLEAEVVCLINQELNLLASLEHLLDVVHHDVLDFIHLHPCNMVSDTEGAGLQPGVVNFISCLHSCCLRRVLNATAQRGQILTKRG